MKLFNFLLLLVVAAFGSYTLAAAADEKWVWDSPKDGQESGSQNGNGNGDDDVLRIVDDIVLSGRSGRTLEGFEQLYADPEVRQALSGDNDTYARSAIGRKLCSLQLRKCDDVTYRHFPFLGPPAPRPSANVIVAQPVALRPVGPPVHAIPLRPSSVVGRPLAGPNHVLSSGSSSYENQPIFRPLGAQLPPPFARPRPLLQSRPLRPQPPVLLPPVAGIAPVGGQHVHQHYHYHTETHGHVNGNGVAAPLPGAVIGGPVPFSGHPVYENSEFLYKQGSVEDCDCVPLYQCDEEYVKRTFTQQHLLIDPRSKDVDIGDISENSTDTTSEESVLAQVESKRKRRDVNAEGNGQAVEEDTSRSFKGGPVKRSCQNDFICCPHRNARKLVSSSHGQGPQCGVRNYVPITGRVKNIDLYGGDADFGEYPWQVAILRKENGQNVFVAGGVLIDDSHVLTSAHNLIESEARKESLVLRLGEYDVRSQDEIFPHVDVGARKVAIHPEFNKVTLFNDIALITLDRKLDLTSYQHISAACLPSAHVDYTGERCWTAGWGKDDHNNGHYQTTLKEVDLPIVDSHTCQHQLRISRLGVHFNLFKGFICAGGEAGKDACKGDGGSPLVCQRPDGAMQVVGIVSWGLNCGMTDVPGVYTKVAHYLNWIRENVISNEPNYY